MDARRDADRRKAALRDTALRDARSDPERQRRRALFHDYHVAATAFLYEIVMAADCLRAARAFDGAPAMHFGPQWRLLRAVERCGGAPTFADLGRLLRMSRQAARAHALVAARAGVVELFQAPEDRRAWQVALTPAGRRALEQQRMPQFAWTSTLLNGLKPGAMRERTQRGIGSPLISAISPRT